MYDYIKGDITELTPTELIVENGGIGYKILISIQTYSSLAPDTNCKLYLYHHLREDIELLYGFFKKEERELFSYLIGVSGIGPNTARMMLSSLTTEELRLAIIVGDLDKLTSIKGIGLKTAQRLLIDLKDKIGKSSSGDSSAFIMGLPGTREREEAYSALVLLGFTKKNIDKVLNSLLKENPAYTLEELIKHSLKKL
ncbi:MAG: Holliday junction branch migration protein RuvA [Bacteroidales bacterium]